MVSVLNGKFDLLDCLSINQTGHSYAIFTVLAVILTV